MSTEVGEYLVGAYLKMILGCQFVDYNIRTPGGGSKGLNELDVIGFDFANRTAYLCEVTTHILGAKYGNNQNTINTILKKHAWQQTYAKQHLSAFPILKFQFWSPVVPSGIEHALRGVPTLDLVTNKTYTAKIDVLRSKAKSTSHETGNPVFRTLQILEHLR